MALLSLIIPVYLNEDSLGSLLEAVGDLDLKLEHDFEAVFVVDGSPDRCYEILRDALSQRSFRSQLILLSKNFGSFMAIRTGLQAGKGDRFAVMAADLQEPPELVLQMSAILATKDVDVVVGVRESREDPMLSRMASSIFWWVYRRYVITDLPPGGVDMFGCNKAFRDSLLTLNEGHSSLVAQIFWLGFRREIVTYSRRKREHGKSAWTFRKKLNYLMDSVFSFTDLPVRILVRLGMTGSLVAMLLGVVVLIAKISGMISVPGYAMTILIISFLGSLNLLGIGIVGSYAWRAYENTKNRPLAIPMRIESFGSENE
ncbi:glycosyltransferase family 2 protein [Pseudomonas sp. 43A]|uniref:glycosyltransferase family 2 protein n=1 Tax=unclassified Pseudomonas TaxID=196821 RepID=UPI0015872672|nr:MULTISPECIES: glycosyltransferase family 2 protein [unclassified Pseudomonas]QKV67169.1 glycosyltransferase family 2 protein [Pseudomonas sp. 43A]QMW12956.1 glycosyltransferase family 2 protein [Pseudomonas sp. 29A]